MAKEYIERNKVIEAVKGFAKAAIEDGKQKLDVVDDVLLLVNSIELIPGDKVLHFNKQQLELTYKALRHYSAYGKEEEIIEQISDICEIMNVIDTEEN